MNSIQLPRIVGEDDTEDLQKFFQEPQKVKFMDYINNNERLEAKQCAYDALEAALLSQAWTEAKVLRELYYWRAALFRCVEPVEKINDFILKFEKKLQNDGMIALEQRAPTESPDELVALTA